MGFTPKINLLPPNNIQYPSPQIFILVLAFNFLQAFFISLFPSFPTRVGCFFLVSMLHPSLSLDLLVSPFVIGCDYILLGNLIAFGPLSCPPSKYIFPLFQSGHPPCKIPPFSFIFSPPSSSIPSYSHHIKIFNCKPPPFFLRMFCPFQLVSSTFFCPFSKTPLSPFPAKFRGPPLRSILVNAI